MNGKGSKPRPYSITKDSYDARWEAAFRKPASIKELTFEPVEKKAKAGQGARSK